MSAMAFWFRAVPSLPAHLGSFALPRQCPIGACWFLVTVEFALRCPNAEFERERDRVRRRQPARCPANRSQKSNAFHLVAATRADAYCSQQQSRTVWWFDSVAADEIPRCESERPPCEGVMGRNSQRGMPPRDD
jgi:hypothetical protein